MKDLLRALRVPLAAAASLLCLASAGFAVSAYIDANGWDKATSDYRRGYAAGAVDMLRALQDANYLAPAHSPQAAAIAKCSDNKDDSEIAKMYVNYITRHPDRRGRSTASAIYNAVRESCNIR